MSLQSKNFTSSSFFFYQLSVRLCVPLCFLPNIINILSTNSNTVSHPDISIETYSKYAISTDYHKWPCSTPLLILTTTKCALGSLAIFSTKLIGYIVLIHYAYITSDKYYKFISAIRTPCYCSINWCQFLWLLCVVCHVSCWENIIMVRITEYVDWWYRCMKCT